MKTPLFVLINGRGGVGKTATLHSLLENPPQGWVFYDFDHGKFPPPKDGEPGREWREQQHNWWLQVAAAQAKSGVNVCVLGVGIFPWQVPFLDSAKNYSEEQFKYAVITCTSQTRRERLAQRGTTAIAEYDPGQSQSILTKMKAHGVVEFSSENTTPADVAGAVASWLESLTNE